VFGFKHLNEECHNNSGGGGALLATPTSWELQAAPLQNLRTFSEISFLLRWGPPQGWRWTVNSNPSLYPKGARGENRRSSREKLWPGTALLHAPFKNAHS
jgi:hypothetical protein